MAVIFENPRDLVGKEGTALEPSEWLTIEQDLTGCRLFEAEQDLHQRRLAGAVLTADGMNGPRRNREGHVAERHGAVGVGF